MVLTGIQVVFQLNDVIALEGDDVIRQITEELKLSSVVCSLEGFKSMGVKAIKTLGNV